LGIGEGNRRNTSKSASYETLDGRTRFAVMTVFPVPLDFDIQDLPSFLHLGPRLLTPQQIRTEVIQFAVQRDELIHQIVLYLTVRPVGHVVKPLNS
jgi:hypothetical protein